MNDMKIKDIYGQLADALDRIPNGFPRTPSSVEIKILQKIFTPEEAWLAGKLTGEMESVQKIAKRIGLPQDEVNTRLTEMAGNGFVWGDWQYDEPCFRLAPFLLGIYNTQLYTMDHEFSHLVEEYLLNGGAVGIMQPQPAIHRVIPAQRAVKSEWILPYDDVKEILLTAKSFNLHDCICRVQQDKLNHHCNFPLRTCLNFTFVECDPTQFDITQDEALALLDQAEEIGLVHAVSNVMEGIGYICNCCGCCCGLLRAINELGIENSVARANYYAVIDPDICQGCGTCIERCQVGAVSEYDGIALVERERCIGCGLCVTGCPNDANKLQRKPDAETVHPPADFATWESQRLLDRGLIEKLVDAS